MTYLLEITQSELDELDAIISRWGNPDVSFDSQAERIMCTTLHPLLLQLKSVCTVPAVIEPVDTKDAWRDLVLVDLDDTRIAETDGKVSISRSRTPVSGVVNGNFETSTIIVGEGGLDDIIVGESELINTNPIMAFDLEEFEYLTSVSTNPITVIP
jgi:hypothetical protein